MPIINKFKILLLLAFAIIVSFCSCADKGTKVNKQEQTNQSYQCPMKCSGELFTVPGNCPICKMELEKVNPS